MQVAKWGNSLAIRLPKSLVDNMKLKVGDELQIVAASDEALSLARATRKDEVLKILDKFRFALPADYKFDRDEANQR